MIFTSAKLRDGFDLKVGAIKGMENYMYVGSQDVHF